MNIFTSNENFVVYGIGNKTEQLLKKYDFRILGIMDSEKTGQVLYGKKVLSEQEVNDCKVKAIVIAARAANIPIIYRRIKKFCTDNQILCYNLEGEEIKSKVSKKIFSLSIENIDFLKRRIDEVDVVSFDVFDTLICRKCLYPTDVFELMKLPSEANKNIFEMEYELAIPRNEVIELFRYAVKRGKDVCCVSDMYLNSEQIFQILKKCRIHIRKTNLFVSSDYKIDKEHGLFSKIKMKYGEKSILHIGDSLEADYNAAKEYGLNAVQIESRLERLQNTSYSVLLDYDKSLDNRMVIAYALNSSFSDLSLIAPIIYKFTSWLKECSKEYDMVLLGARDGYLIDAIQKKIKKYQFRGEYFLTSRTASTSASIFTTDDIENIKKYPFLGTKEKMYEKRFATLKILSDDELISHSEMLRTNYISYIHTFGISSKLKIAFMDFVSVGTCFYALKKILPFEIEGLFAIKLGEESDEIKAMFSDYMNSALYKNYFLLEQILCSLKPSLMYFTDGGKTIYFEEKRTSRELLNLEKLQNEILKYGNEMEIVDFNQVDLELCDFLYGLCQQIAFSSEDEFCGR